MSHPTMKIVSPQLIIINNINVQRTFKILADADQNKSGWTVKIKFMNDKPS